MMRAMPPTLLGARVAIVSGKGGVGKTTVAASIAVAAAKSGSHVLLCEIEDREAFAPIFGLPRLSYTEQPLAPNISGLTIEADEAMVEYLQVSYGIPRLSRALIHSRAIEFATHTAPGLKDILLIGKVWQAERQRQDGRHLYDLIVLDAPPTGRLPRFLDAPRAVAELVGSGPIKRQAKGVADLVGDPARFQVVLVTSAEEMPVRETAETVETIRKMGIALGPIVVNGMLREIKGLGRDPVAALRDDAVRAGLPDDALRAVADVAAFQSRRARNQRKALRALADEVPLPRAELPFLFADRIARAEVDALAARLGESGLL
jgi:anion-transporting  ArsA/GET3 family ATPase